MRRCTGKTKYTAVDGIPELKQAICAKFKRDNGLDYTRPGQRRHRRQADPVQRADGDAEPRRRSGDPAPYWVSYPDMVLLAGGEPVIAEASIQTGFKLTPDQLEAAITPKTKWLIFNSPSNPTGAGYTRDELKALTDVLMRHPHVWVMTDDMYEHLVYDDFEFCTPGQVEPALYRPHADLQRRVQGLCDDRLAHRLCGGPEELIAAMRKIQSQSTSNPCSISQWAAVEALNGTQDFMPRTTSISCGAADLVVEMLNAIDGIACPTPEGAFYVYPSIAGLHRQDHRRRTVSENDESFRDGAAGGNRRRGGVRRGLWRLTQLSRQLRHI